MKNLFPGLGERSGFADLPALLVVDMTKAFTDSSSPLACNLDYVIPQVELLLTAARHNGIPIIFTTVAYGEDERTLARSLLKKMPAALICEPGSRWVEIDERLPRRDKEPLVTKVFPSAFFGTTVLSYLISVGCDSVIICGASTSGCVRATAVDAVSHGFAVIVPAEAVGDRSEDAHRQSLSDIDLKYGDVVSVQEVIDWLDGLSVSSVRELH